MICPICNETKMTPIWYGHPDERKLEMARADMIVLGGYPPKEYTQYCLKCNETYPFRESLDSAQ
jgi:hypothetical protein